MRRSILVVAAFVTVGLLGPAQAEHGSDRARCALPEYELTLANARVRLLVSRKLRAAAVCDARTGRVFDLVNSAIRQRRGKQTPAVARGQTVTAGGPVARGHWLSLDQIDPYGNSRLLAIDVAGGTSRVVESATYRHPALAFAYVLADGTVVYSTRALGIGTSQDTGAIRVDRSGSPKQLLADNVDEQSLAVVYRGHSRPIAYWRGPTGQTGSAHSAVIRANP
jgi:hypothetical protein